MSTHKVFVNGRVHVRRTQCKTCIFRPGNLMNLVPGRVEQMVADATAADGCIPCHHHLHNDEPVEPVCRGFYDRHATTLLQIAERLDFIEWVD
jgi:hypothetical protein